MSILVLHPGDMGSVVGECLVDSGHDVVWVSAGRSPATTERARQAGLREAGSLEEAVGQADFVLSVCPPHGATDVAGRIYDVDGGDAVAFQEVKALGRLAEGIRRLRVSRGLTQSEIARFAGVSQSAIAQTESGQRGLNLETLLTLGDPLGVSLDEILDHQPRQGYVLARRDRIPARRGVVPFAG